MQVDRVFEKGKGKKGGDGKGKGWWNNMWQFPEKAVNFKGKSKEKGKKGGKKEGKSKSKNSAPREELFNCRVRGRKNGSLLSQDPATLQI